MCTPNRGSRLKNLFNRISRSIRLSWYSIDRWKKKNRCWNAFFGLFFSNLRLRQICELHRNTLWFSSLKWHLTVRVTLWFKTLKFVSTRRILIKLFICPTPNRSLFLGWKHLGEGEVVYLTQSLHGLATMPANSCICFLTYINWKLFHLIECCACLCGIGMNLI